MINIMSSICFTGPKCNTKEIVSLRGVSLEETIFPDEVWFKEASLDTDHMKGNQKSNITTATPHVINVYNVQKSQEWADLFANVTSAKTSTFINTRLVAPEKLFESEPDINSF